MKELTLSNSCMAFFKILFPLFPLLSLLHLGKYLFYPIVIIFMLFWLIIMIHDRDFKVPSLNDALPLFLFYSALASSLISAKYPRETFEKLASFGLLVWCAYLAMPLFAKGFRKWFLNLSTYMYLVILLCFTYILISFGEIKYSEAVVEDIGFFSPTSMAMIVGYYPFYIYMLVTRKHNFLITAIIAVTLPILMLVAGNRSAFILLGLGSVFCFLGMARNKVSSLKYLAIATVLFAGMASLAYMTIPAAKTSMRFVLERSFHSSLLDVETPTANVGKLLNKQKNLPDRDRILLLLLAYEIVREHPLSGIGFHGTKNFMESRFGYGRISHNIIVTAWAEGGLISLLAFLFLTIVCYSRILKSRKLVKKVNRDDYLFLSAALISLTLMLLHAMFQPQEFNPIFLLVIALALSSRKFILKKRREVRGPV